MLQQTTVRAVLPYYEKWMALFPDLPSLARAPLQKVLKAWEGLGYYSRARNLRTSARIIVKDYGGRLPSDVKALRGLPGFGPYTAAAVSSLAFGRPHPVIDANVRRVLMRLTGQEGKATSQIDSLLHDRLLPWFPTRRPGTFNQAMMELGALVCRSRNPACLQCPVREFCRAAREGNQEVIPLRGRLATKKVEAVLAVIWRDGRFLIQKRPPVGLFADLWEFPGGKIKNGETREAALRREVREETGLRIRGIRPLTTVKHAYTCFQVTLHVFSCESEENRALAPGKYRWVGLRSVRRFPLPSGSVKVVEYLSRENRPRLT